MDFGGTVELTAIVSGGDRGADTLAERYAREHNLKMIIYLSEWNRYGRAAGPIKNKLIINDGDATITFWDQEDRGTNHAISLTRNAGKKLKIVVVP